MFRRRFRFRTMILGFSVLFIAVLFIFAAMCTKYGAADTQALSRVESATRSLEHLAAIEITCSKIEAALVVHLLPGSRDDRFKLGPAKTVVQNRFRDLKAEVSGDPASTALVQLVEAPLFRWLDDVTEQGAAIRNDAAAESSRTRQATLTTGLSRIRVPADVKQTFGKLRASEAERLENALRDASGRGAGNRVYLFAGIISVVILALSFLLSGHIIRPIREAVAVAIALGQGDLSRRMEYSGHDEAGKLADAFNSLALSLGQYNTKLSQGVQVLAGSGAEIAAAASQLSNSATQTAVAVSETTAVVRDMEKTAKVVNENAGGVSDRSQRTDRIATSGSQATEDTIRKMDLIKDKMETVAGAVVALSENASHVEEIVATVQDLAEQSNLLAVNASIEAARAGEQGKGFAVVAQEIKSLADQSHEATQRVNDILQEIRKSVTSVVMSTEEGGKAVNDGVEQSQAAGRSIRELAESIVDFSRAANVIYTSSEQQFSRVERVAGAMEQVETVMRNAVDGTAQLQTEAKRLEELGHSLNDIVQQFKT